MSKSRQSINQKEKRRSFVREVLSVMGSKLFIIATGFVTTIILSRLLGPDGKGILTSLLIFPTLFVSLAEMGIRQATIHHLGKQKYSENNIISVVLSLLLFSSFLGVIFCGVIYRFLNNQNFTILMILLALLFIPLNLISSYSRGILLGKEKINLFNRISCVPVLIRLFLVILLVWLANTHIIGAIFANLIAASVTALYALWLVSKYASLKIKFIPKIAKEMLSLGVIYAIALFVMNLNYKIDIVLLERLSSAAEIGQYTTGVTITELIWQLPAALGVVLLSRSANAKDSQVFTWKVAKLLRVTILISIAGAVALSLAAPILIPTVYGQAFLPSARVLQILMPGVVTFTIFKVLNMDLAGKGRPEISLAVFSPAVLVNIALNFMWIPKYGANGAALASTISYSLSTIVFLFVYARVVDIKVTSLLKFQVSDWDFIYK